MEKSASITNIAKALMTFRIKVEIIKKDAKNPFFKSSYASLSNVLESIEDPLIESGLTFVQFPSSGNGLTTLIMHAESGEYIQDTFEMRPAKDDPQGRGSVITYQRRYALAAIFGLNIEDDDDANRGTHGSSKPKTTLYNHKSLEKDGKPLISNLQFSQLIERVKGGDLVAYNKALNAFSFEATQKELLEGTKKSYSIINEPSSL